MKPRKRPPAFGPARTCQNCRHAGSDELGWFCQASESFPLGIAAYLYACRKHRWRVGKDWLDKSIGNGSK